MRLGLDTAGLKGFFYRYRLPFIVAINVAVFCVVFYLLLLPQHDTLRTLQQQHKEVMKDYETLVGLQKNMAAHKREFAKLQEDVERALSELPDSKDIPNILRTISLLGGETRIKVRFFEPKPVVARDFYAELPIELRYSGSYQNLGQFFDEIRKMQRIVHVPVFSFEAKGPAAQVTLDGTCTARTFLYVRPPEKGAKEKKG